MLSHKRDTKAAKLFLRKLLSNYRNVAPKAINTDNNFSYSVAIKELKVSNHLPEDLEHRKISI